MQPLLEITFSTQIVTNISETTYLSALHKILTWQAISRDHKIYLFTYFKLIYFKYFIYC